jgi:multiple sugar transport system permease protein
MSLGNTLEYIIGVTSIDLAIGLFLAYVINVRSRIQGAVRVAVFIPMFTAPVVMGLAWRYMYNAEYGIIDYLLRLVGLPGPLWLSSVHWAIWAVIIADVYETAPFAAMIFFTCLQTIPRQLYEAARTDSASPLQTFRYITLPYLVPAFVIILIVRTIEVFKIFDIVYVLTGGGPAGVTESLSIFTYTNMVSYLEYGYASAASWLMVGMSLGLSFLYIRQLRRSRS